ncbi:MAG TPA: SHOCT domain-containing protein [Polyangiales bacterium]
MQNLTAPAEQAVQQLSQRFGVSVDAVKTLLAAVNNGGGTMAQFYHPELGGGGQWMRGGMTMVGDMFNSGLQATVSGLCAALSELLATTQVYPPLSHGPKSGGHAGGGHNNWWPAELGSPSSSGGQNDTRYAYFPATRRLALEHAGRVTVYDSLDHQIGGVQQQQGGYGSGSLSFSSQYGTFSVQSLPQVSPAPASATADGFSTIPSPGAPPEVIETLERLGRLVQSGVLTEEEFRAKKAELLARL